MEKSLLVLELNEVNFDMVARYAERGDLPAFAAFFAAHGYTTTTSEANYDELEPWIQWVTAHTGMTYAEHGIFRLGDIVDSDHPQIWERLEALGFSVGAISPMNAKMRLRNAAFFVPDPWTATEVVAPGSVRRMARAISQAVNDNAKARLTPRSAVNLAIGGALTARFENLNQYLGYLLKSKTKPWLRSLFLDRLLADLFSRSVERTGPQFATLFLNAAAHIQHHYMFNSPFYDGTLRNPDWYVNVDEDPLLDVFRLYDTVLGEIIERFPSARIMLMTGLHQDPHPQLTFYWRLIDHAAFLHDIGAVFTTVEPKMSRDFLVQCATAEDAKTTQERLEATRSADDQALFTVDNRGTSLFVMLIYDREITREMWIKTERGRIEGFRDRVAFVAIKNGQHNAIGYFSDSAVGKADASFELRSVPDRIVRAMCD